MADLLSLCSEGDVGAVREALEGGGDPNYSGGGMYKTCLMVAAMRGHAGVVEELLRHPRIRVNDTDSGNTTALHTACSRGQAAVVQVLVNHPGIDWSGRSKLGRTPLELAEKYGRADCARILQAAMARGSQVGAHTSTQHHTIPQVTPVHGLASQGASQGAQVVVLTVTKLMLIFSGFNIPWKYQWQRSNLHQPCQWRPKCLHRRK